MAKIAVNRGSDVDINTGLAIEENCYAQASNTLINNCTVKVISS